MAVVVKHRWSITANFSRDWIPRLWGKLRKSKSDIWLKYKKKKSDICDISLTKLPEGIFPGSGPSPLMIEK